MRREYEGDTESQIGADVRRIIEEDKRAQTGPSSPAPDPGQALNEYPLRDDAPSEGGDRSGASDGESAGGTVRPQTVSARYGGENADGTIGYPADKPLSAPPGEKPWGSADGQGGQQPPSPDKEAKANRRPMTGAEARALKARRRAAEKEAREQAKRMAAQEKAAAKAARRAVRQEKAPYVFISWFFVMIFLSLVGYLIYFNLYQRDIVLDSPYNRRSDIQMNHTVRGAIVSSEGNVLSSTEVDDEGNEHRVYPYGSVFAHAVGYSTNGRSGIESFANYELLTSHINFIDRMVNELKDRKSPGDTVVTTLSGNLQKRAWEALGDRRGAVVAIDPQTGAIRAMVSKPDFDPNTIAADWKDIINGEGNSQLVNRVTQGLYAPGSTFKIATALAYYREHGSLEGFAYDCTGELTVGDHTVHCYEHTSHGEVDLTEAFARSCNCAFSAVGLEVGAARLSQTAEDLLFGQALPCEYSYKKSRYYLTAGDGEAAMMQTAFGQGDTLVTPYHMALLVSAIANKGVLMKPQIIWKVESTDGKLVYENNPASWSTLLTRNESAMLTELMERVVTEGTGSGLSDLGYSVAGKTGSAEFTRGDGSIGTHAWFVGFSNVSDPDLVVAVLIEDGGTGSGAALPVAREVFEMYRAIHRGDYS